MLMIRPLLNSIRRGFRPTVPEIVRAVRADSLTFLEPEALADLFETIQNYERNDMPGILIEAGCAAGGSSIVMATAKSKKRRLQVYDVFGMIPPPSEKDEKDVHDRYAVIRGGSAKGIGDRDYYGYEEDLLSKVQSNFERHGIPLRRNNVQLIKGLFEDTLQVTEPVLLAHIDGDWYESVHVCLERISPALVPGGVLVIDDYYAWSGCRKAVDDFFIDKRDRFDFVKKSRLHVIRK
ncbi:MAG: TylF/MycF/NovP-related O-methyltransferase [Pseudomonadota bacterium]